MTFRPLLTRFGTSYIRASPILAGKAMLVERFLDPSLRHTSVRGIARTTFGVDFEVDSIDEIQRHLLLFGAWEPNLTHWLGQRLRAGDVFVDVGANIGYFSAFASARVGHAGGVIAIEPSPETFDALARNVRRNDLCNVRLVRAAVADAAGDLELFMETRTNCGNTSAIRPDRFERSFLTTAMPLESILIDAEVRLARLVKIDVEGMEHVVIRSLARLLDRMRPDVEFVIEISPRRLFAEGTSAVDAIEPLLTAGFHVYRLANDSRPHEYPSILHGKVSRPYRWRQPFEGMSDFVFSRTDAELL